MREISTRVKPFKSLTLDIGLEKFMEKNILKKKWQVGKVTTVKLAE
jgi:hypothetical protein